MRKQLERAPVSCPDAVVRDVVTSGTHPAFNTPDVDLGIRRGNKEQCYIVAEVSRPSHQLHFAGMRHHRLEAEAQLVLKTPIALKIGDGLRLARPLRLR